MDVTETVRVKAPITAGNDLGYVVINKADLTDAHELLDAPRRGRPRKEATVETEQTGE